MRLHEFVINKSALVIALASYAVSLAFAALAGYLFAFGIPGVEICLIFALVGAGMSLIITVREWSKSAKLLPSKGHITGLFLSSKGILYFKKLKVDENGIVYYDNVPIARYNPAQNIFYLTSAPQAGNPHPAQNEKELGNPLYLLKDFGSVVMLVNETTMSPIPKSQLASGETLMSDVSASIRSKIDLIYRMIGAAAEQVNRGILSAAMKGLFTAKGLAIIAIIAAILIALMFLPMLHSGMQKTMEAIIQPR